MVDAYHIYEQNSRHCIQHVSSYSKWGLILETDLFPTILIDKNIFLPLKYEHNQMHGCHGEEVSNREYDEQKPKQLGQMLKNNMGETSKSHRLILTICVD